MKMIVCVKAVPTSDSIKFDDVSGHLIREGNGSEINPYDLIAVEAALQLKEKTNGDVLAVSMGPHSSSSALRSALSMGVDHATLLSSPRFSGADVLATSSTLSAYIKSLPYDILIFGKHSTDGDTGQVGSEVAEMLKIPHACNVCAFKVLNETEIEVSQRLDDRLQTLTMSIPCLLIIENDFDYPRNPSLINTIKAKKAVIEIKTESDFDLDIAQVGFRGSATRVAQIFVPVKSRKIVFLTSDQLSELLPLITKETL